MNEFRAALERIYAAPRGPQIGAFFDYDGTLIDGFSAAAFYRHRLRNGTIGPIELSRTLLASQRGVHGDDDFASFLALSLAHWSDTPESEMADLARTLWKEDVASRLHHEMYRLLEAHRAMGHTLVLASSATRYQLEPVREELELDHILFTELEVVDGMITGEVVGRPLWGREKARGVKRIAEQEGIDLDESFGYSNGDEDVPFLETVAYPAAVSPEDGLREVAELNRWPVLDCRSAGGGVIPDPVKLARTAGFWGTFGASFATGIGLGLLQGGKKETMAEIGFGVGADVALAASGVEVEVVEGSEHLWSARPCIFVFNHQSNIDAIVVMKLLRTGFTGVAKAEAKKTPMFGQMFQIANVAFVERDGNKQRAQDVLAPAVAKVTEEGYSLALAPEGTRSLTPKMGKWKKGAFHIAMQAKVPMVALAIRNGGEIQWRGSQLISPGKLEIAVLPPFDTSTWKRETIDEHVAEVRDAVARKLLVWPGEPAPPGENGAPRTLTKAKPKPRKRPAVRSEK